jgi:hypothetical protein
MAIKARIWWDQTAEAYVLSVSYSESFVNAIKQLIPSGSRQYDPNTKFWYVKEDYGEFIRKLAETTFGVGSISFTSKQVAEQSQQARSRTNASGAMLNPSTGGSTEDAIVAFFGLLPFEAAKKSYLIAAQQYHPDHNPADGEKMMKLNQLWDRIQKEFFKR